MTVHSWEEPTATVKLPSTVVLWLIDREAMPRNVLTPLRHSVGDGFGSSYAELTLAAADWLFSWACALTHEFIDRGRSAERRYGFSVHGADAVRMESHAARVELLDAVPAVGAALA